MMDPITMKSINLDHPRAFKEHSAKPQVHAAYDTPIPSQRGSERIVCELFCCNRHF
jgi:hypothetical protein